MSLWYISAFDSDRRVDVQFSKSTFVKELRSKMFRQHPGYYQVVFLKKTQMIIVSFYEYTVYIMFWIVIVIFCPNIIAFCSVKLYFFLKVIRNPASKSLQSIEISLYLAFTNEWNVAKQEQLLMYDLFYLEILFCWGKVNVFLNFSN
jgi:hypothetical protein